VWQYSHDFMNVHQSSNSNHKQERITLFYFDDFSHFFYKLCFTKCPGLFAISFLEFLYQLKLNHLQHQVVYVLQLRLDAVLSYLKYRLV
jgi:uncharacterized protein (DUF486 family)